MSLLLLLADNEASFTPDLSDIGALLHARTTLPDGSEAGTFNTLTHPTGTQVQALIDLALPVVLVQLPETVPEALFGTVKMAVALQVAIMVERSFFPEQVNQDSSMVDGMQAQLDAVMTALLKAAEDSEETTTGSGLAYGVPITTVVAASSPWPTDLLP